MPGVVRLDWYTVFGVGPDGTGEEEFLVESAYVDSLRERRLDGKYYDAILLSDVLGNPTSIFRGLKRISLTSDGLCYCGKPSMRYLENAVQQEPPLGMVFAVYVFDDPQRGAKVVTDWDWWPEDQSNPGRPLHSQDDYEERTWPKN